jgi:hypothetical protein
MPLPWLEWCCHGLRNVSEQWAFPKFSSAARALCGLTQDSLSRCQSLRLKFALQYLDGSLALGHLKMTLLRGPPGPHCRSISSYALRRPEVARWGPSMTQLPCQVMDGGWWGFDVLICFDMFWYWNSFWNSELMTSHCTGLDFDWSCPSHLSDLTILTWLDLWFQGCRFGLPITQGISVCCLCSAQGTPGYTLAPASTSCNHVVRQLTQTDKQRGI